jgi:hypothetical protein
MHAKVTALVEIRRQIADYEKAFEEATAPLKAQRDQLQHEITEELKKMGVLSQRFQEATVSRTVRKTVQAVDEKAAVAALKERGLTDYISETINDLFWKNAAKEIAKQGKTDIPGLVVQEKEFLSVHTSDKDERRKVVTD